MPKRTRGKVASDRAAPRRRGGMPAGGAVAAVGSVPPSARERRAKLFVAGRSQAVRLPRDFRLPGSEVRISREGRRIILEPIEAARRDANGWTIGIWQEIDALLDGRIDDWVAPDDPVPPPIPPMRDI